MKTSDARQLAREFLRLLREENPYYGVELLSAESICKRLDVSRSWFAHRAKTLPRVNIGGTFRYPFAEVVKTLSDPYFTVPSIS